MVANVTGFPSIEEIKACKLPSRKKKSQRDLGLDLGSRCLGWGFGIDKKLIKYGKFVFKSNASTGNKLEALYVCIDTLVTSLQPTRIIIEKPPTRRGSTTARLHEQLGIIRAVWARYRDGEDIKPSWLLAPKTIKRALEVRSGVNHKDNKKIMVNKVNELYNLKLKFAQNSRYDSDDDIADAIAVLEAKWKGK